MIRIITVGKIKESFFKEAIEEYKKRLSKYTELEIIEVEDEKTNDKTVAIRKECERIDRYINTKDYIISLAIEGKELSSTELASKIDNIYNSYSNITFIIGGSCGLSDEIKNKSNMLLSFSKMTFPHQLFRIILLEQIYRSYKINNNEEYHK
jgi:23S rRNA (pseudouridine1915-N3)-methyltransferase